MVAHRTLLAAVVLLLPLAAQAQTYRWMDSEGNVYYSDTLPPPGARKIEQIDLSQQPAESQPLPYELQRAAANFPVTLYVTNCGEGCSSARQLLAKRGVPHTELDPSEPATNEALKRLAGVAAVPVLQVGRQVLKGYDEQSWNDALDFAGYPKSALIKITPRKPPKPTAPAPELEQPAAEEPGQPAENPDSAEEG
jgi:hypothetical protein